MRFNKIKTIVCICTTAMIFSTSINVYATPLNSLENTLIGNVDTEQQLNELIDKISDNTKVSKKYIKIIIDIADENIAYTSKNQDIYNNEVLKTDVKPFSINGNEINYIKADFIECNNKDIDRPSPYYIPDALYSVVNDISKEVDKRYKVDRKGTENYFNALSNGVKNNLVFYEALLSYLGASEESVDKMYTVYEKIMYNKDKNENIIEIRDNKHRLKYKYSKLFNEIGIYNSDILDKMAVVLSYDQYIAENDSMDDITDTYVIPYELNKSTRENMMIAAASLCGKVRYVWGGGHSGASYIDGINPAWEMWENLYSDKEGEDGYRKCIKPSGTWCPIHGDCRNCWARDSVKSLNEYIDAREELFGDTIKSYKYRKLLNSMRWSDGVNAHAIDGLDCSGFASWLYNQVTDKYNINSTAVNFTDQYGINGVNFGDKLLPGDVFAWTTHIVVIVGQVRPESKAYVTIEQTPNVLKYGVVYYAEASQKDIDYAKQVAAEANELIGNINAESEAPHCYCMNNVGRYKVKQKVDNQSNETVEPESTDSTDEMLDDADGINDALIAQLEELGVVYAKPSSEDEKASDEDAEEEVVEKQYFCIGRLNIAFEDSDTKIQPYDKTMNELTAEQIIQHTINKLPLSYVSGYNTYNGSIFDKKLVSSEIGNDNNENE